MSTYCRFFLLLVFGTMLFQQAHAQLTYQEAYAKGVEAYEQGNHQDFLGQLALADSLRPNHRVILYNLAVAYALNDFPDKAMHVLEYRAGFFALDDFSEDEDLTSLKQLPAFVELKRKIEQANQPVQQSVLEFKITKQGFHPEGITYSWQIEAFLISDVRCGLIMSIAPDGSNLHQLFDLKKLGYWGAMGISLDPQNEDHIWVSTSVLPNYCEFSEDVEGKAAVLKLDINTGHVLAEYAVEGDHIFGDLTLSKEGTVYFTDSIEPVVYRISPGSEEAEIFIKDKQLWNLQGLALSGDKLYVSDYITGIYVADLQTKIVEAVSKENQKLRGTDGLYRSGNRLIMLQNGTRPFRVSSIELDEKGLANPDSYQIIDTAHPDLNEPTLGTVYDGKIYFISNSPWAFYDDENKPVPEDWPVIQVRSFELN